MRTNNQLRIILVEIMVAVLFFGLAATILMETFAAGYTLSRRAGDYGTALEQAQNIADQLWLEHDDEAVFTALGWQRCEDGWTTEYDRVVMTAEVQNEPTKAGVLHRITITAAENDKKLLSITADYYETSEEGETP